MPRILVDVTEQDAARLNAAIARGEQVHISTGAATSPAGGLQWPTIEEARQMAARLEANKADWPAKFVAAEELIWQCCKGAAATSKGRESVIRAYADVAARAARAYGNVRLEQDGNWEPSARPFDLLGALGAAAGARVSRAALAESSHSALLSQRSRPGDGKLGKVAQNTDLTAALDMTGAVRVGETGMYRVRVTLNGAPSVLLVTEEEMAELGRGLRRPNPSRETQNWLTTQARLSRPPRAANPEGRGGRHRLGQPLSVQTSRKDGLTHTAYAYDRVTVVESRDPSGAVQVDEYF